MTTGRLCAFTRDAFLVVHEDGNVKKFPAEAQPIAQAVAASSAFPPLFPPLRLDLPDLPLKEFDKPEYLTDGGVFDNLGISRLHCFVSDETKTSFGRIIVSDASAHFDHAPHSRFLLLPSRASRTTDILMQRVASLEAEIWNREQVERLVLMRISDVVDDLDGLFRPQPKKVQRLLKGVRTDFDAFEVDLIRSLAQHGYEVGFQQALGSVLSMPLDEYRRQWIARTDNIHVDERLPWDPCPPGWPNTTNIRKLAQESAAKEVGLRLLERVEKAKPSIGGKPSPTTQKFLEETTAAERRKTDRLEALIAAASTRRIGLWNRCDWAAWVLAFVALALIVSAVMIAFHV
jgi:hypothetical protein